MESFRQGVGFHISLHCSHLHPSWYWAIYFFHLKLQGNIWFPRYYKQISILHKDKNLSCDLSGKFPILPQALYAFYVFFFRFPPCEGQTVIDRKASPHFQDSFEPLNQLVCLWECWPTSLILNYYVYRPHSSSENCGQAVKASPASPHREHIDVDVTCSGTSGVPPASAALHPIESVLQPSDRWFGTFDENRLKMCMGCVWGGGTWSTRVFLWHLGFLSVLPSFLSAVTALPPNTCLAVSWATMF